jgi:putative membrane protein
VYPNYWWHMGWMWLFWILVIVAIIWLFRAFAGPGRGGGEPRESPEQILKQRYARGEIDKDEYERRLSDLRR